MTINTDAIFISDAHENVNKHNFYAFLLGLKNGAIPLPSQLFLLGDMFDILTSTSYFNKFFKKEISLLNELSQKIELFYFEGNHDFNLREIFTNAKVFSLNCQPVSFDFLGTSAQIAHGDIFLPFITQKSLAILRNKSLLGFLDFIDRRVNSRISKKILASQAGKKLDFDILNFKEIVAKRITNYKAKIIIEGHWHQGKSYEFDGQFYLNPPSLALKKQYFKLESKNQKITLKAFKF